MNYSVTPRPGALLPPPPTATELHRLHALLAGRPSLLPGPEVDRLFSRLVELVVTLGPADAETLLADPTVQAIRPHLQDLCARGECELERAWADRIAAARRPAAELERFPYLGNYRLLTRLEWSSITGVGAAAPRRLAFLGSGPLPLSPLLLAHDHGVTVDAFDRDRDAVNRSRALLDALDLPGVRTHHLDVVAGRPDLHAHDVVVLAALVGATPEAKRRAVRRVQARMRPGSLLIVRSAHGARSLLYPPLDLDALDDLELLSVVHPYNQVVNSIVVARKRDP